MRAVDDLVEALEEGDGFQVLASPVDVRDPLSGLARVVAVDHGGDGVDAEAIHVVALQPEERVADEEVGDLAAAVVEDPRAPVGVLALPRIGMLEEMGTVEVREPMRIAREVGGDPVEYDADAALVEVIYEGHEVVGTPVAAGGSVVAEDLIAPGAVVGVLHD